MLFIISTQVLTLLVTLLLAVLFVLSGSTFLSTRGLTDSNLPNFNLLKVGLGYFIGMGLFLCVWRLSSALTGHLRLSLLFSMACLMAVIYLSRRHQSNSSLIDKKSLEKLLWSSPVLILASLFVFLIWFVEGDVNNVYSHQGTLHSGRYAFLSSYMLQVDKIPIISQNYGQSLLSTISGAMGLKNPLVALYFWLACSEIMLILVVYGTTRFWGFSRWLSVLSTLLVMMGNATLSKSHVLSIDSGSPLLMNGYSDSVNSVGSLFALLFLFFLDNKSERSSRLSRSVFALALFSLGFSWNIFAPQNIVTVLPGLSLIVAWAILAKKSEAMVDLEKLCILGVGAMAGLCFGGMLTPKFLLEPVALPGLMGAAGDQSGMKWSMCIAHVIMPDGAFGFQFRCGADTLPLQSKFMASKSLADFKELIYAIWQNFKIALGVEFFPLLGLGTYAGLLAMQGIHSKESIQAWKVRLLILSLVVFVAGFLLAFAISLNNYKWELTRFLIPGSTFGMLFFSLSVCTVVTSLQKFRYTIVLRAALIALAIFPLVGPFIRGYNIVNVNVKGSPAEVKNRVKNILIYNPKL